MEPGAWSLEPGVIGGLRADIRLASNQTDCSTL
jgi:hypothetical protein